MQAITVRDRAAGAGGLSLTELPYPQAAQNDVVVRVYAAGFTPGELDWPTTWSDHAGRDRTPSVPGHELSGVVAELGYGTTGLTVGQRVFGLADWTRNGSLAEYAAVEARNLAPLPADVDHTVAAALPISGLTAWQGLFDHARLTTGQTVLIHGAAGGVGSIAVQLAREAGARVIGTERAADRDTALGLGADAFVDLQADGLEDAGEVDVVFDVIGGQILERSTALVRAGGTLLTITAPPAVQPGNGRAVFFVVEPDRARLADLAQRPRDGRIKPLVGAVRPLSEAPAAFAPAGAPPARRSSGSRKTESRGPGSTRPLAGAERMTCAIAEDGWPCSATLLSAGRVSRRCTPDRRSPRALFPWQPRLGSSVTGGRGAHNGRGLVSDPCGLFGPTIVRWYRAVQWFDGDGFADLLRSTSLYCGLDNDVREPLLDAIAERIRTRMGDRASRRYLSVLRAGQCAR